MSIDWSRTITAEARAATALEAAKAEARVTLAAAVTAARAALITDLPGQSMIYLAKEAEAARWAADPAPDLADYPLIAAEIGITAPDGASLAQIWLNLAALWRSAAADLEALRLTTRAAIDAATTLEEVGAAVSQLVQVQG
ncbi:hypothetical protein GCM10007291_49550 [Gemmobacter nanjingensis]|uniref:Uncharacterized protein n=1 Tax=Gemmobacter nanjingensis TaxID=488454 RepID=A0ABQ3FUC4_9RHOB|nr:hypothetical protein [Gemmobacter nanjingensis]GHC41739.1 hypothetical protein GCM10007291_49550 [Gemmobacter nanjingensis]